MFVVIHRLVWHDDLGQKMFTSKSEGCEGVKWCFDPAVLADDKGNAYIYFGGGNDEEKICSDRSCVQIKI